MNGFKDSELILVGGRELATCEGRLRLLHETNERLSITTAVVEYVLGSHSVVRAELVTSKGTFSATGTATATRDARMANSLLELSETRAVCRCARLAGAGFGVGVEEMDDAAFQANAVPDARGQVTAAPLCRINPAANPDRRPRRSGTPATAAQRRCIDAIARRVHVDPGALVARFAPGLSVEDLSIGDASRVIDAAKRTAGTNGDGGGHA